MAEARLDARRASMLAAMGVEVYRLRSQPAQPAVPADIGGTAAANDATRLLIVCARGQRRDTRLMRLYAQLPRALCTDATAIAWAEADVTGAISPPPEVPAYLVLGSAMARALGAHLSTAQQQASVIAVTADATQLPGNAVGKRALWQVLKPIARALRGAL